MKYAKEFLQLGGLHTSEDDDIYADLSYSGRGMCGETTEGIVVPSSEYMLSIIADAIRNNINNPEGLELIAIALKSIDSKDNMGYSIILY